MDRDTFNVLSYVSNYVFGSIVDISDIINKIFPFQHGISEEDFKRQKNLVTRFLDGLEKPGFIDFNGSRSFISSRPNSQSWVSGGRLNVLITTNGLTAINQEKFNRTIKSNNRGQTIVLVFALAISILSLAVSWLNYCVSKNKSAQTQYLLPSKELIEVLTKQSQVKKDETHRPIAQNPTAKTKISTKRK